MLNAIRVTDLEFEWVGSRTFADKSLPNGAFELYTSMEDNGFVGMVYVALAVVGALHRFHLL